MKKSVIAMVLAGIMIFAAGAVYGDEAIKMLEVKFDRTVNYFVDKDAVHYRGALVYEDTNYAPVRPIAEAMGAKVTWDEGENAVVIDTSKSKNFEFTKIQAAIDMYLKDENIQGKGTYTDRTTERLIEGNFKDFADAGFKVLIDGDKNGEHINISLPDVQRSNINTNGAWKGASQKIFGDIMQEFTAKKWDFCGTMNPNFEGNFVWVFSANGGVAVLVRGEYSVGIHIYPLGVFVENTSQKDLFQDGYNPATDGGLG